MVAEKGHPSIETGHYFGTDEVGRDLYSRVIQGTQISLMVGILGSGVAVVVGTIYGAVAGYFGGRLDSAMMRFVDIIYSIPYMFILILLLIIFGRSFVMLFVGIGLISWLGMARVVRGQTLTLKNREFVEAAIATGVEADGGGVPPHRAEPARHRRGLCDAADPRDDPARKLHLVPRPRHPGAQHLARAR